MKSEATSGAIGSKASNFNSLNQLKEAALLLLCEM
jgi:hypothetical protein